MKHAALTTMTDEILGWLREENPQRLESLWRLGE